MLRRTIPLLAIALTLALFAAPRVSRADSVVVTVLGSQQEGIDTMVNIVIGGRLQITAAGRAGSDGVDGTPDGNGNAYSFGAQLPFAPIGTLIGKVTSTGDWFIVGSAFDGTAPVGGRLYLAVNSYRRPVGSYVAQIYFTAPVPDAQPMSTASQPDRPIPPPLPPPAPVNFRILSNAGGTMVLGWDASSGTINVYSGYGCACFATLPAGSSNYTVGNLPPGSQQCFIAYAANAGGNSGWTAWACDTAQ